MKKLPLISLLLLSALIIPSLCACSRKTELSSDSKEYSENEMKNAALISETENDPLKAVWLSQYDMRPLYLKDGKQRSEEDFAFLTDRLFKRLVRSGFNTVFLQVRPFGDSFYPSRFYPVSPFVSGGYGKELIYDPLKIAVSLAKANGLYIHAWVNPYRCMTVEEINDVPDEYRIKRWYLEENEDKKPVFEYNGRLYLSPADPETRKLIKDGIEELINNYDIDGIHFDDYFYPTSDESADKTEYEEYLADGGQNGLARFRLDCVNVLIKEVYSLVKEHDSSLLFGVSPAGSVSYAYKSTYADVYTWGKDNGYVDYLAPQIYFGFEHQTCPFDKTCREWEKIVANRDVDLVFGLTFHKAAEGYDRYAGDGKDEWSRYGDVLKRSLVYTETVEKCSGVAVFGLQYIFDPVSNEDNAKTKTESDNFFPEFIGAKWKSFFYG